MTAYWLVFAIMFLLQFIQTNNKKEYLWKLIFTFIPLFLYGAFRINYGYDYEVYEAFYNVVERYGIGSVKDEKMEYGYAYLNHIMPSFRCLIIFTTLLTCLSYIIFFYRLIPSKYTWLAIILLFLTGDKTIFFMFSGIRNAISISILLLSTPLLEKRKLLPFILTMILASLFHKTALIYFPLAYLCTSNKSFSRKELWIWICVYLFLMLFSHSLNKYIEMITSSLFNDRYESYLDTAMEIGDNRGILLIIANIIMMFPLLIYMRKLNLTEQENIYFRLGLLYILSYMMGVFNMRTSHHYMLFYISLVIYIWANCKKIRFKYAYVGFVILFFIYAFFIVYVNSSTFPYSEYNSVLFL